MKSLSRLDEDEWQGFNELGLTNRDELKLSSKSNNKNKPF